MGIPPGWGLEHRASNPVSVKNLTTIETSTIVKLLRPYIPVGMKRASKHIYIYIHLRNPSDMLHWKLEFQIDQNKLPQDS
jgi:hypothetical protein